MFFVICLCTVRGVGGCRSAPKHDHFHTWLNCSMVQYKTYGHGKLYAHCGTSSCTAIATLHSTTLVVSFKQKTNMISYRKLPLHKTTSYSSYIYYTYSVFRVKFLYFVTFNFLLISVKSDSIRVHFWSTEWVIRGCFPTTISTWKQEPFSRNCYIFINNIVSLYVPMFVCLFVCYPEVYGGQQKSPFLRQE